jgi:glyoxylase-like metal-dependent hydrolase (beta-lactamase superfamily II)
VAESNYVKGPQQIGAGTYAYLQPEGQWGFSNSGFVVGAESTLLVDTLFTVALTAEMLSSLRAIEPRAERIDMVVNTHANGDHCYGNQLVADARIFASSATAFEVDHDDPRLLQGALDAADEMGELGDYFRHAFGEFDFHDVIVTSPTERFNGSLDVDLGARMVEFIEVGPAHTAGDVVVHVPDVGVVFAGDILFIGGTPIMWAGPAENWIRACHLIESLAPRTIVPGHGPLCGLAQVREVRGYWEYLMAEVRARHERGMQPWDATRDISLERYAHWLDPERLALNVAMIYHEQEPDQFLIPSAIEAFSLMARLRAVNAGN